MGRERHYSVSGLVSISSRAPSAVGVRPKRQHPRPPDCWSTSSAITTRTHRSLASILLAVIICSYPFELAAPIASPVSRLSNRAGFDCPAVFPSTPSVLVVPPTRHRHSLVNLLYGSISFFSINRACHVAVLFQSLVAVEHEHPHAAFLGSQRSPQLSHSTWSTTFCTCYPTDYAQGCKARSQHQGAGRGHASRAVPPRFRGRKILRFRGR